MKKQKKNKRPKSKRTARLAKRKLVKSIKITLKKFKRIGITALDDDLDFVSLSKGSSGLKTYEPQKPVHPFSDSLQKTEWMGLLTLKLHSHAYSKDDLHGGGRKNRFAFIAHVMKNLCNRTFRVKESELKWVICDEFGKSGVGHVHVLFSFDYLKAKGREDKIPKIDFSQEKGDFYRQVLESANFFWRKLNKCHSTVNIHWRPMWENEGLVNYFCKLEDGREEKHFKFSRYWEIHENLLPLN